MGYFGIHRPVLQSCFRSSFLKFTAPHTIEVCTREVAFDARAQPNHVLIRTRSSAISSGTELKIFTGTFDTGYDIQRATLTYLLGCKISLPEVFWYPIIFVKLEKLGTKKPLVNYFGNPINILGLLTEHAWR